MKISKRSSEPLIFPAIILLGVWPLQAAPDDELRGEQTSYSNISYKSDDSFWDPSIWRNLTDSALVPIVPGEFNYLYFGVKSASGSPIAVPTENFTLYTAARLGFSPPAITPLFNQVDIDGDEIIFNGIPDVVGAPFGRFALVSNQMLTLRLGSRVEFDRTVLNADSVEILGSSLTISGDVTPKGDTYNFRSLGNVNMWHSGTNPRPALKLRSDAIANLAALFLERIPATAPATSGSAIAIESGSQLNATTVVLSNPSGNIFDASAGYARATLGQLSINGSPPETDPAAIFHATGVNPTATDFSVTGNCFLNGFRGTLAQIEDGANFQIQGMLSFVATNSKMGLKANRGGQITLTNLKSSEPSSPGSAELDWRATTGGELSITQSMTFPLKLNGEAHTISALSGGMIDIPDQLGLETGGRLLISASGTNSELRTKFNTQFAPFDFLNQPSARWSHINLSVTNGALLRGGLTEDLGGGNYYAILSNLLIQDTASRSDLIVTGASLKNIGIGFQNSAVDCVIGTVTNPAILNQVSLNVGDSSTFIMRNSTWQPERVEMIESVSQGLQVGQDTGGSLGTITDGSVVHNLQLSVGTGPFSTITGQPTPVVNHSIMNINGSSTVTGSLAVAHYPYGKGTLNISGSDTRCGFDSMQLGVSSTPLIHTGPSGPLVPGSFEGEFFSTLGGLSALNVTSGARVAVGSYQGAYSQWRRPETSSPAYLAGNDTPISIDATSAIYLGDADSASNQIFQNGALVVGSGGYLVGTGTILGNAADGNDLVNSGGYVSPGFSPGTLTVDGNFLMESGTLVLEVKSNSLGDFDTIVANSINITGGTIIIRPAPGYSSGTGINADFLQSSSLTIGPGVSIQIDPELGSTTWNSLTGELSVVGGSENDLNGNSIDDRIEAVLPVTGNQVEWPQLLVANPPILSFRRKKPSLFAHDTMVQWSSDLIQWTSIPVPYSTEGQVLVTELNGEMDLIEVTLPSPNGGNSRIFTRLAVSKSSPPF